jgi:hypothetical protein
VDLRNAGRSTDQHDLVDLRGVDAGIGQRLSRRSHRPLQQVVDQLLELRPRQLHLQVLRAALVRGDERKIDVGLHDSGELHLGLLGRLLQTLERHPVLRQINAVALPELSGDPVDDSLVQVVAAEMGIAVGGLHLDHAFAHFEDRYVERAAAEVVHGDRLVLLLVEAVGERGCGRLVDDAHDLEAGDLTSVLGGLALRVVEVRRHRDDRLGHRLSQVLLCRVLELLQDHRGDFRRRVLLAGSAHARIAVARAHDLVRHHLHLLAYFVELAAHEPLDREDGVLRVGDRLPLGHLSDQPFAGLREGHDRWRQTSAFRIGDHDRFAALHHRDNGVRGAQVDTDDFAH